MTRGAEKASPSNLNISVDAYTQSIVAHRCVRVLADLLSTVPFRIYDGERLMEALRMEPGPRRRDARAEAALPPGRTPVANLFDRPNALMDGPKFWSMVATQALLTGQSFVRLKGERTSRTRLPESMIPQRRGVVTPDRPSSDLYELRGWRVGSVGRVSIDEIVRVEYATHPDDPLAGVSPIGVARLEIESDYLAQTSNRSQLAKGGTKEGLLKFIGDGEILEEQLDQAERRFNDKYATGGPAVPVLGKNFEFQAYGFSRRDLQWLQGRQFSQEQIGRLYGVMPLFLGVFDAQSLSDAGVRLQKRLTYEIGAIPLGVKCGTAYTEAVIRPFDKRLIGMFDWDAVEALGDAISEKLERAIKYQTLGFPLNEINRLCELGMPDVPHGDVVLVPAGMATVESVIALSDLTVIEAETPEPEPEPTPALPAPEPEPKDEPDQDAHPADDADEDDTEDPLARSRARAIGQDRLKQWHGHQRALRPKETKMLTALRRDLIEQRAAVLRALTREGKRAMKRDENDEAAKDAAKVDAAKVAKAFNPERFAESVMPLIDVVFGKAADNAIGEMGKLGIPNDDAPTWKKDKLPKIVDVYHDRRLGEIVTVGDSIREAVNKTIIKGMAEGENLEQLVERVRGTFRASATRARVIARTEANSANNGGRFAAMKDRAGFKEWLTSEDEKVREDHVEAGNDGVIPFDEPFSNGLMHPHDPAGDASAVCNCRCVLVARARGG